MDTLFHHAVPGRFRRRKIPCRHDCPEGTEARSQGDFVFDRAPVLVATNAFGMGMISPMCALCCTTTCLRAWRAITRRRAGPAGTGKRADCILLFSPQDVVIDRMLIERKRCRTWIRRRRRQSGSGISCVFRKMTEYCRTTKVSQALYSRLFRGCRERECGNCSNCLNGMEERDMTEEARWLVRCVSEARGRFGTGIVTGALTGARRAAYRGRR